MYVETCFPNEPMLEVTHACSTILVHTGSVEFCCWTGNGNLCPFLQHAIDLCTVNKLLIEMESDLSHTCCAVSAFVDLLMPYSR